MAFVTQNTQHNADKDIELQRDLSTDESAYFVRQHDDSFLVRELTRGFIADCGSSMETSAVPSALLVFDVCEQSWSLKRARRRISSISSCPPMKGLQIEPVVTVNRDTSTRVQVG